VDAERMLSIVGNDAFAPVAADVRAARASRRKGGGVAVLTPGAQWVA
jgi:hypothetical protein